MFTTIKSKLTARFEKLPWGAQKLLTTTWGAILFGAFFVIFGGLVDAVLYDSFLHHSLLVHFVMGFVFHFVWELVKFLVVLAHMMYLTYRFPYGDLKPSEEADTDVKV